MKQFGLWLAGTAMLALVAAVFVCWFLAVMA